MTTAEAFRTATDELRGKGLPIKGTDIQLIAALNVFEKRARGLEHDARFAADAPRFASRVILEAYANG